MEINEIKDIVQMYFDACFEGDGKKMSEVLNGAAHVYGRGPDGALNDMDKETFVKLVGSVNPDKPRAEFPRQDEIISIDFTGENTAVARVKLRLGSTMFTDILTFINLEGKWTIISKLYSGVTV